MRFETDPKNEKNEKKDIIDKKQEKVRSAEEIKQQQSDPNLTELKGFIDPKEKLEPEGTDNPF
jgi:hypothetical protein